MLDYSAEGRLQFCSEPRDLVVHLALHLRSRQSLWSLSTVLQAACTCMPPVLGSSLSACSALGV